MCFRRSYARFSLVYDLMISIFSINLWNNINAVSYYFTKQHQFILLKLLTFQLPIFLKKSNTLNPQLQWIDLQQQTGRYILTSKENMIFQNQQNPDSLYDQSPIESMFNPKNDGGFSFFDCKPHSYMFEVLGDVQSLPIEQMYEMKPLDETDTSQKQQQYEHMTTNVKDIQSNSKEQEKLVAMKKKEYGSLGSIFKQKKLKGSFKKNTNVPKVLARIFLSHYQQFVKHQNNEQLMKHHNKVKKSLKMRLGGTNAYKISDILSLLGQPNELSYQNQTINRRILSQIIQSTMHDEVLKSNYIKSKQQPVDQKNHEKQGEGNTISYLMAMKIYSIRCRSKDLTGRVKIF